MIQLHNINMALWGLITAFSVLSGWSHLQKLGADFKLGRLQAALLSLHSPPLNPLEELTHGSRDDPLFIHAHSHIEARAHGVRLPRPSLPAWEHE